MIEDTIRSLEARLQSANGLTHDQRRELEGLVATLKSELSTLPNAGPTGMGSAVVKRANHSPQSVREALDDLNAAVAGQEAQHPKITELINSLSLVLSNTGI
jgi:ABC-type transporter Mla subunit MlaD